MCVQREQQYVSGDLYPMLWGMNTGEETLEGGHLSI